MVRILYGVWQLIPSEIYHLMDTLEHQGYEALIVGGAVRDKLLRFTPQDYDLATNATPDEVEVVVASMEGYTYIMGAEGEQARRALTSLILTPDGEQVEITTYRAELGYEDGNRAKPIAIPAETFTEDSARRDITINSMGMDKEGKIYDPMNGRVDLENKIVRAVGNPNERFQEDALRMIRAIRFTVRFNFSLDRETERAIRENVKLVSSLSPSRLRIEIGKVLYYPNGYKMLMETGILPQLMPELRNLKQYKHNLTYHPEGNVYNHYIKTFETFTTLPSRTEMGGWATLFHDIAKPETADWQGEYHTYYGHDKVGSNLILERYRVKPFQFSNQELKALAWTTEKHLQQFWEMKKPSKVAEMANNKNYPLLIEVVFADSMGMHDEELDVRLSFIEKVKTEVNERRGKTGQRPEGFAMKVFNELNIPAGKARGEVMAKIDALIDSGNAQTYDEALDLVKGESVSFEATYSGYGYTSGYGRTFQDPIGWSKQDDIKWKNVKPKSKKDSVKGERIHPLNYGKYGVAFTIVEGESPITNTKTTNPLHSRVHAQKGWKPQGWRKQRWAGTQAAEHYTDVRPMTCPICIRELSSYDNPSAEV
jgi:tRNA nucleotidyltransferase (CCA-adding enzyme)